jgi:hypothetical protein
MAITSKVSNEQRRQMIAEAAYYRAQRRGFGVDPVADWIEAEAEVDERVREVETARLLEHLENGLAAVTDRVTALKKKLRRAARDARTECEGDVERLAELRDALREKVKHLRTHGEKAGQKARRQAEKLWDEINDTMHRVAARVQH